MEIGAGGLFRVVFKRVIDVRRLEQEQNLQVLHYDLALVECYLRSAQTIFENLQEEQKDIVDMLLNRINHALAQAKLLLERVQQQRNRCFGCCILCNHKLSRECGQWTKTFDGLFQNLQNQFACAQMLSNASQSMSVAKSLLLQPVPDAGFVGSDIKRAEMQLRTWLAEPPHRVVGVWGMGGIGKTSLLRVIHNHFQKVSIFEIVIWVTVSQNFNIGNLQNSIAKALDLKSFESLDNDSRRMRLLAFLEKEKFLLILDDAWEQIDLDEVGIGFGNADKGSKVLISTRKAEVIGAMGARKCSLKLQPLSEEEAWQLFKRKAFINDPAALDKNIEAIAREIAKECKGLPLAVNVVGATMTLKKTKDDWGCALTVMRNPIFPKVHKTIEAKLYKQLRYSYNDLSDHLQSCFLYLAAFCEDEEIDAERLVEIWIAEGLLTDKETTYLMDVGHYYLDQLANCCLIQYVVPGEYVEVGNLPGHYEYVKTIKIHDVFRDMVIHIGESEEHWLFATDQHLTNFPGEKEISNCNRISLGQNDIQDLPTDLMKCSNLVSLLLPSNQKLSHVTEQFLRSVTSLRVLDLSNVKLH